MDTYRRRRPRLHPIFQHRRTGTEAQNKKGKGIRVAENSYGNPGNPDRTSPRPSKEVEDMAPHWQAMTGLRGATHNPTFTTTARNPFEILTEEENPSS